MKVGILGSGIVGRVLASAFLQEGHEVMVGSRSPEKEEVTTWKSKNPEGMTGHFSDAASFGELLVLATKGTVVLDAIALAGTANLQGKVVIDATNPISDLPPVNGVLRFFTDFNESLMEKIQHAVPQARLVKAFSCVGNAYMYKPSFDGQRPTMFICGNDEGARNTVTGILDSFGWETADMGSAEAARFIEPLCGLWCIPGFRNNEWSHAFKLLKK